MTDACHLYPSPFHESGANESGFPRTLFFCYKSDLTGTSSSVSRFRDHKGEARSPLFPSTGRLRPEGLAAGAEDSQSRTRGRDRGRQEGVPRSRPRETPAFPGRSTAAQRPEARTRHSPGPPGRDLFCATGLEGGWDGPRNGGGLVTRASEPAVLFPGVTLGDRLWEEPRWEPVALASQ